jgi:hypothetical protein
MLNRSYFIISAVGWLLTIQPADAQSLPNLTPQQIQRFGRDLTPRNSDNFFRQGRDQFEREIQLLDRRVLSPDQTKLKIDPALSDPERLQPRESIPLRRLPNSPQK